MLNTKKGIREDAHQARWAKEGMLQLADPTKKVLFECNAVQKEVVIPAGVKLLVLKTAEKTNAKSPDASVVYLTEEY